jgi:hypothetical protein
MQSCGTQHAVSTARHTNEAASLARHAGAWRMQDIPCSQALRSGSRVVECGRRHPGATRQLTRLHWRSSASVSPLSSRPNTSAVAPPPPAGPAAPPAALPPPPPGCPTATSGVAGCPAAATRGCEVCAGGLSGKTSGNSAARWLREACTSRVAPALRVNATLLAQPASASAMLSTCENR